MRRWEHLVACKRRQRHRQIEDIVTGGELGGGGGRVDWVRGNTQFLVCLRLPMCVCVCVRACVRECVSECVRVRACMRE